MPFTARFQHKPGHTSRIKNVFFCSMQHCILSNKTNPFNSIIILLCSFAIILRASYTHTSYTTRRYRNHYAVVHQRKCFNFPTLTHNTTSPSLSLAPKNQNTTQIQKLTIPIFHRLRIRLFASRPYTIFCFPPSFPLSPTRSVFPRPVPNLMSIL